MAHNYEKLESWKRGCQLTVSVHDAFRGSSEYVFRDQMLRSSLSIPSNIAEGSERQSEKEFLRYINFAISSAAELRTQALICQKAEILPISNAKSIAAEANEIGAMLRAMSQTIKSRSSS